MVTLLALAIRCAVISSMPGGPGDHALPLALITPAEATSYYEQSMFMTDVLLGPFDSHMAIGPWGGPPSDSDVMDWIPSHTYSWSLTWDASLQELAMEVRASASDITRVEMEVNLEMLDSLLFRAAAQDASVLIDNWVLDGTPLDSSLFADSTSSEINLLLTDYDFSRDWRLKGNLEFAWSGDFSDSAMAVFSIFGTRVPAPGAAVLLGLTLLRGARRRR
jgi:hypothetical protein